MKAKNATLLGASLALLAPLHATGQATPLLERLDWRLSGDYEPVLVTFQSGKVSFRGCNQHTGQYQLKGNVLVVENLASTEMACTGAKGKAMMDVDDFLKAQLTSSPRFSIEGNTLRLRTTAQEVELEGVPRK